MKRCFRIVFLLAMSLTTYSGFSQDNLFIGEPVTVENNFSDTLDKIFIQYSVFKIDGLAINEYVKRKENVFSIHLQLGNEHNWNLDLHLHDIRSPNSETRVGTDKGIETLPRENAFTYRGNVNGSSKNTAHLSIRDNIILGSVFCDGEEFFIEPLNNFLKHPSSELFVVYNQKDIIPLKFVCGFEMEDSDEGGHEIPDTENPDDL